MRRIINGLGAALIAVLLAACGDGGGPSAGRSQLLNVSYDPTREFYEEINAAFAAQRSEIDPEAARVSIEMSHGGSGRQARAVIDGLPADVVTLALP